MEELTEKLIKVKIPKSDTRLNVLQEGDKGYEGFVGGLVRQRWGGINKRGYSIAPKILKPDLQEVYEMARKYGEDNLKDFKFTSIQFNRNYKIKKHIDRNNEHDSYIIALGDYTGGELLVYFDGKDNPPTPVDIKNKFYTFDGSKYWHEVAPFEGNRISLVYYNILKPTDVSKEEFCKEVDSFEFVIAIKNNIKDIYFILDENILEGVVEPEQIYIFAQTSEIRKELLKTTDKSKYNNIIIGDRDAVDQTDFIYKFFPDGTNIIFCETVEDFLLLKSGEEFMTL